MTSFEAEAARHVAATYKSAGTPQGDAIAEAFTGYAEALDHLQATWGRKVAEALGHLAHEEGTEGEGDE